MMAFSATILLVATAALPLACHAGDFAAPPDSTWRSPWVFHVGLFGRVVGSEVPPDEELGTLFSTGFDCLRRGEAGDAWGAGVRIMAEVDRGRWALGGIWRRSLGASGKGYWQLSPGLTIAALGESEEHLNSRFPGGYLEAEIGYARWGAVSALLQLQPYRFPVPDSDGRVDPDHAWQDDTDLSIYLGGKVFGWRGFFLALALGLLVVNWAGGLN